MRGTAVGSVVSLAWRGCDGGQLSRLNHPVAETHFAALVRFQQAAGETLAVAHLPGVDKVSPLHQPLCTARPAHRASPLGAAPPGLPTGAAARYGVPSATNIE